MNSPFDAQPAQELDAPKHVLELLHAAMLYLGLSPDEALAVSRTGGVVLEGLNLGFACDSADAEGDDDPGASLVVAAQLPKSVLETLAQRRGALLASTELMAFVGAAIACDRGQPRLISRWCVAGQSTAQFATWLRDFAKLGVGIAERQRAGDSMLAA